MKSNRILYSFIFILSLMFVYFYGGRIAYTFFYVVLFLPLISSIYILLIRVSFKYTLDIDRQFIMKGDIVKLLVKLNNKSVFFYPFIKISFCDFNPSPARQYLMKSFSLLPFSKRTISFCVECKYRGCYQIGISSVVFVDFLGIIKLTKKKNISMPITVYPKVIFLEPVNNKNVFSPQSQLYSNLYDEDMIMISDLRKYVFGDSVKRIHWKLTAKKNEIIVKNFEKTMDINTVLMLDLKRNDYRHEERIQIEDKVIEAVAALTYLSLSNQIPVHLTYCANETTIAEARDLAGFDKIHRILAEVKFTGKIDIGFILEEYIKSRKHNSNIFIVTPNINNELFQKLCRVKSSGFNLTLVFISDSALINTEKECEEKILSSLFQKFIKSYVIDINDEFKIAFERQII
jgi:uncharacterized protein (DUF58 family)